MKRETPSLPPVALLDYLPTESFTMTTSNVTVASSVDALILAAGKAAGTMYSKAKEAAKLASSELDASKPLGERIALVMTAHAAAFTTAGANVKSIFADALTLYACPTDAVTVPTPDKKVSQISTAIAAVDLAKHTMRAAAKEVRDIHGLGRKVTPKVVAPKATVSDDAGFKALLNDVAEALKDPELATRFIAFMGVAGYVVAPKVKATGYSTTKDTAVKSKTLSLPSKVKSMADLPSMMVQGSATH